MPTNIVSGSLAGAFLALCEDANTPRSLAAAMLLKAGEWDQLVSLDTDPSSYNSADAYFLDVCVSSFFRKTADLPTTFDRKAVAVSNFWKCERSCYLANERLSRFVENDRLAWSPEDERIGAFLHQVRKEAVSLIGYFPPSNPQGRHGPGATFLDRGKRSTVPHKMSSKPTLTRAALPHLFPWCGTAWAKACAAAGKDPIVVKGNRFTTVPKDCKKDRGIAVEPSINLFYQLGVGRALRARLKSSGLDLQHAQDVHRRVACEASKEGYLCTEDLSNASDTICTNLVKLVLPEPWYDLLWSLRSPYTRVDGKWLKLEKFSSMGNGYTFELETVVFTAVISAVMRTLGTDPVIGTNLFVYGDDIIFPAHLSSEVNAAMAYLGMTVNEAKSFVSGPFRESCGGDFFEGTDVRPYFLKETPSEPQELIALANGIRAMGTKSSQTLDPRFRRAWFRVLDAIPSRIRRLRGPIALGDLVIHDEEAQWQTRWRHGIRYIRVWRPARHRKVPWSNFRPEVILASALYGVESGANWHDANPDTRFRHCGVTPRDSVLGYKEGWTPYS